MTCAELREKGAGLAALPPDDPERLAAYAHASSCATCRASLHEAEQMLVLIDAAPPPPAPSPAALQRTAAAIRAELAAERATAQPAATAAAAAAARWRQLARLAQWLTALLVLASIALAIQSSAAGGLEPGEGLECLGIELGSAALALFVLGSLTRSTTRGAPRASTAWLSATAAGAGAMAGQVVLLWRCPAHGISHLTLFHIGGVLAALALGAAATRLLRPAPADVTR